MKSQFPGYEVLSVEYATTNPQYPESHAYRYVSKRVCDATWGRKWTIKIWTVKKKIKK